MSVYTTLDRLHVILLYNMRFYKSVMKLIIINALMIATASDMSISTPGGV